MFHRLMPYLAISKYDPFQNYGVKFILINGVKQGIEIVRRDEERIIVYYVNGERDGISTYTIDGELTCYTIYKPYISDRLNIMFDHEEKTIRIRLPEPVKKITELYSSYRVIY